MQPKEIDALKRACLYSIPPNRLGYCGPKGSWQAFEEFLSSPIQENALAAKSALVQFRALVPYLELIAEQNGMRPFDAEVIEAYWLGSPLLESISYKAIQGTILSLQKHGLPRHIAEKKASQLPEGILPHHSMHVLYINFISQKVPALIQNLSSCLVQWGEVQETNSSGITLKGIELISESGELKLREKTKAVQNPFSLDPQANDLVTVHWNQAIQTISQEQKRFLQKYTGKTISLLQG